MTDNKENKLRMYYTVSAVCDYHYELWQDNEVFVSDYQRFKLKIPKIEKCRDLIQIENILAETFKSFDRVELEELAYYTACKLRLFAIKSDNKRMIAEISDYRDSIYQANHYDLINICNVLADYASLNLNNLADYNITLEGVSGLQKLSSSFFVNMKRTKSSHFKNKTAEELLRKYIREADDVLRSRTDNNIEFYRNSDPEFYGQYKAARVIFEQVQEVDRKLTLEHYI